MCFIEIDVGLSALIPVLGKPVPDVVKDKKHGLRFQVAIQVTNIISDETGLCIYVCLIVKIFRTAVYIHINRNNELVLHILVYVLIFFLHALKKCTECRHILGVKCGKNIGLCISLADAAVYEGFFLCVQRVLAVHT